MASRTYLADILDAHRRRAEADRRPLSALEAEAAKAPSPRRFTGALAASEGLAVIAEIKRRSPSKGDLDPALDPARLAGEYGEAGATCLSVLTDTDFFGGSPDDLARARAACDLPVLRKDFTVSEADVYDARIMGADAVLLIVAALDRDELERLHTLAGALGLDALVEVHDRDELERALALGATLVGVNRRNLRTFEVDHDRATELAALMPPEVVAVAESGVRGGADAARLADAGYRAVLVGETLDTSKQRAAALAELRGHPVTRRGGTPSPPAPTRA
jgi:indole-3-glycerol phosphate synthase